MKKTMPIEIVCKNYRTKSVANYFVTEEIDSSIKKEIKRKEQKKRNNYNKT
jgi:hypothetical protein